MGNPDCNNAATRSIPGLHSISTQRYNSLSSNIPLSKPFSSQSNVLFGSRYILGFVSASTKFYLKSYLFSFYPTKPLTMKIFNHGVMYLVQSFVMVFLLTVSTCNTLKVLFRFNKMKSLPYILLKSNFWNQGRLHFSE